MEVRLIMGLRRGQYPNESDEQVFARLRQLSGSALSNGFSEVNVGTAPVTDPADATRTLDTFFEIVLMKQERDQVQLLEHVRFALGVAKTAESRH
jgi:hypothetical protein